MELSGCGTTLQGIAETVCICSYQQACHSLPLHQFDSATFVDDVGVNHIGYVVLLVAEVAVGIAAGTLTTVRLSGSYGCRGLPSTPR